MRRFSPTRFNLRGSSPPPASWSLPVATLSKIATVYTELALQLVRRETGKE
jgi:hypothetical protein